MTFTLDDARAEEAFEALSETDQRIIRTVEEGIEQVDQDTIARYRELRGER
jgi:hypothetical protein